MTTTTLQKQRDSEDSLLETPSPTASSTQEGQATLRVIFLDMDGVMNSERSVREEHAWREAGNPRRSRMTCEWLPSYHVEPLNHIIEQTRAKVVISSTWRLNRSIEEMQSLLTAAGVKCEVIGMTDRHDKPLEGFSVTLYGGCPRGSEIQGWLDEHPEVESFVILDDDGDMDLLLPRLVKTNFRQGLTFSHAHEAIELLNTTARPAPEANAASNGSEFQEGKKDL